MRIRQQYHLPLLLLLLSQKNVQGFLTLSQVEVRQSPPPPTEPRRRRPPHTHRRILAAHQASFRNDSSHHARNKNNGAGSSSNRKGGKGKPSQSKDRDVPSLSQRNKPDKTAQQTDNKGESILPPPPGLSNSDNNNKAKKRTRIKRSRGLRNRDIENNGRGRKHPRATKEHQLPESFSSLLPPPLGGTIEAVGNEEISTGLSSWDDFLSGTAPSTDTGRKNGKTPGTNSDNSPPVETNQSAKTLPSIDSLFPSGVSTGTAVPSKNTTTSATSLPKKSLDGVLPVSDLFFRATTPPHPKNGNSPNSSTQISESTTGTDAGISEISKNAPPAKKKSGRKMVRRGMEMLVGGRPVNADPPMRSLELFYRDNTGTNDWASTVLLNTRDFGPLLHMDNVARVSAVERGLFCEYWVDSCLKWDICPSDLKEIAKNHVIQQEKSFHSSNEETHRGVQDTTLESSSFETERPSFAGRIRTHDVEDEEDGMLTIQVRTAANDSENERIVAYEFGGAIFEFEVGLSESDLQNGDTDYVVLKSVLTEGVMAALRNELQGFDVEIAHFTAKPLDPKSTSVSAEFNMKCVKLNEPIDYDDIEKKAVKVMAAFADAVEGDLGLALAEAALNEHRWPRRVREAFVEDCLDGEEDDDDDSDADGESVVQEGATTTWNNAITESFAHGGTDEKLVYGTGDLFLGNGNDGVFYDHAESSISKAPYSGKLGLRLVDAVLERAKQRQPRVIAVGDVHGCIDELQDLLRQCDYRPGDLVVFLGDLVCKGPDSVSVVQMAREIGAIGVRGNHDFEVVRWHEAIKSGVDPPVVRSEHYHVASCLSKADIKWMSNLPWFMSSKDLGALFVHAGFVSGVRLAKQNPRLMMNMRSILPDGTVTSKFFNNWPWARLWDGPQTVLFGHDADRGLQQYEHAIGLDTGCVYGGRLTACILPERRLVSVSARREYFKYRRKKYD